ncbi:MAG: GNAT family N-acetyltransferase [Chloroflexi bacterium]|nr:GNAT family N-acetyltransferase [Chloroflexota bacterium]
MTNQLSIQQLPASAITRIGEIDRTEHITLHYTVKDGQLIAETVDWQCPPWSTEGAGPHSVAGNIHAERPIVENGGVLLGALDGERLAGLAVLRYKLTATMAQLAFLHVTKAYRRQGVSRRLLAEVIRLAKADGATELYVSATPSGSAVGFYTTQGFVLTQHPHPELFALEPEDIHMIKPLV